MFVFIERRGHGFKLRGSMKNIVNFLVDVPDLTLSDYQIAFVQKASDKK